MSNRIQGCITLPREPLINQRFPKIKDLIVELRKAGFEERPGKGSHRNFKHPGVRQQITLSGNWSDDAKHYQVRAVMKAIEESGK